VTEGFRAPSDTWSWLPPGLLREKLGFLEKGRASETEVGLLRQKPGLWERGGASETEAGPLGERWGF